jgi:GntR family transcriptional regulator, transcriptional repressor for pyruvate dehydrogenase complex
VVKRQDRNGQEEGAARFSRVARASLSDHIVEQVVGLISRGVFKPGDRMPPEKELCQQFGVGRTSVREALRSLSVMGMVESHMGDGTFVSGRGDRLLERTFQWGLLITPKLAGQLIETRRMLECQTAQLAALKATGEDLKEVEESVRQMQILVERPVEYLEQDLRFHMTIARATQNSILLSLVHTTRGYLHAWIRELLTDSAKSDSLHRARLSVREHKRILRALQDRDPKAARRAMDAHILSSSADMTRHLARRSRLGGANARENPAARTIGVALPNHPPLNKNA